MRLQWKTGRSSVQALHKTGVLGFVLATASLSSWIPSGHAFVHIWTTTTETSCTLPHRLVYMSQGQVGDNSNNDDTILDKEPDLPFFLRTDDQDEPTINVASSDIPFVVEDFVDRASDLASSVARGVKNIQWDRVKANVDAFASRKEVQGIRDSTTKFVSDALSAIGSKSKDPRKTSDDQAIASEILLQNAAAAAESAVQEDTEIAEILKVAEEAAALADDDCSAVVARGDENDDEDNNDDKHEVPQKDKDDMK